ncbi:MAG: CBS domain-containing protein [Planctomycetota bacterium]|jgi:magnesium transporter|nr:CBS domain-containing protein [Planctomycetota bacterium]
MTDPPNIRTSKTPEAAAGAKDFQTFYFSQLLKRRVAAGKIQNKLGRLTDLVFRLAEPYPEAVGLYLSHGWGNPTEFIPWAKVVKIDDDAIFVQPPEGDRYPPFVEQPDLLLVNEHLMGQTILDMDGRRTEVVNDVHLLESQGRMLIVHVDVSFNGFLRRWHAKWLAWRPDRFISWKYVQPLSVVDTATDTMSLSITRQKMKELPSEDLADILEELTGRQQQAVFSALDSDKAAEALLEAEPRAQRQLVAALRHERARTILSEMSAPQLADLLSILPHDDQVEMMGLLPQEQATRIRAILADREASAKALMSTDFLAMPKDVKVGQVLAFIRTSGRDRHSIPYIYVVAGEQKVLSGVVDLRELLLAPDDKTLGDLMTSPVVSADEDILRDDLAALFSKYQYRMIPVVDAKDHLLGVVHYKDIMKGLEARS